ncbi:MAG: alpha/beta hydrolase family protein [Solirubrobacteraceae bacterium]
MRRLLLVAGLALAWTAPAGAAGTVVLVPGSGFSGISPREDVRLAIGVQHWRDWGFATRLVRYRPGKRGEHDVQAAVARAERHGPVCVYGESSGGTWALLAAATQDAACVVVSAAPTDQETWARSEAHGARVLARQRWPTYFGLAGEDDDYEPYDVWTAFEPVVPAMLIYAASDQVVPPQQGRIFATVPGDVRLTVLGRGARTFVHSGVSRTQLLRARGAARTFVSLALR